MVEGLMSENGQNGETMCTSGGGLKEAFFDALNGVASKNFLGAST